MKLMFIIDQVYLHGGIERVLSIKANFLSEQKNHTVYIITTEQQQKQACYEFRPGILFEDLNINYNRKKSYFHPVNLLKVPKHIFRASNAIKKINPDIVVVCSHSVDTYFMPFIKRNIPKVKEFHYSRSIETVYRNASKPSFKTCFLKFADYVESKYDRLAVLNKDEAAYYTSNNTVIIPNPLTFYPETVSNLDTPLVITAGRIAPVKQYDVLIDIWERVCKKNNTWQLHIYGTGEPQYLEFLQKKIDDKNLENQVFLMGATDQIQNKLLHSSLFVMTSENECFPLVLLEAQACGLPIVSYDCPHGPGNIITPQSGVLIKMNDGKRFAEAVLDLMADPRKRKLLGKQARMNAGKYRLETVMKKWEYLFNELKKTD